MSNKIVGIDLGTTFSAIAVLDSIGNPEILPDLKNNRITASAVYFSSSNETKVGSEALSAIKAEPNRVVTEIKRHMRDEVVYSLGKGEWIDKKFSEKLEDEFTPAQFSSIILKKLKDFGEKIDKAVITVPAMFANDARQATIDAAKMAELSGYESDTIELINEPTAAIFHYANLPGVSISGKVMVVDLGGGTFDVTIAEVNGKKVDVIHSEGNPNLGGKDFDRLILKFMSEEYKNQLGADLSIDDVEYLLQAEELKKILSTRESHAIVIDGPNGPSKKIEITRNQFDDLSSSLIEAMKLKMDSCVKKAKLQKNDISQILLVGGSTRMPCVISAIKEVMGKEPTKGVNVDEAVASGAALYAGTIADKSDLNEAQKEAMSKIDLSDVANHYFGTIAQTFNQERQTYFQYNSIIIEKGSKLPVAKTNQYSLIGDQDGFPATVTQSDGPTENKEFVHIIAQEQVEIKNGKKDDEVQITFSYDKSQIMHCTFEHIASGKKHEIQIKSKTSEEVDAAQKEMKNFTID